MKKILNIALLAVASIALVACNQANKMIESVDQLGIRCNPEVLEVVAGEIDADVSVTFPEGYFYPKATLYVTPVINYQNGVVEGEPFVFQGEKVMENNLTVPKAGATITRHIHFDYVKGMEKSELVARVKVVCNGNEYVFPGEIKIADGANTTYMLVETEGAYDYVADSYQEVIPETVESQILYLINSSDVRNSELRKKDIKDFQKALASLANDERRQITGTEVVAYASPDGSEAMNERLSSKREKSATKALGKVARNLETGDVSTRSIAEDWAGFQELVSNSSIEDKELIIRVLSMYSDPAVREREIRNMSSVYTTLASNVLPQLRRARFITSVEFTNYTAEELSDLVNNNIDVLDEQALLRAAANAKEKDAKIAIYRKAVEKYNSQAAKINIAVTYLNYGQNAEAAAALSGADRNDPAVINLKGVIAMREGRLDEAADLFNAAGDNEFTRQNKAVIDILKGRYDAAVKKLAGTGTCNETIAYILTGQLEKAKANNTGKCPKCKYRSAIIEARQGNVAAARALIEEASKMPALAERAALDVEFIKVR